MMTALTHSVKFVAMFVRQASKAHQHVLRALRFKILRIKDKKFINLAAAQWDTTVIFQ